MKQSIKTKIKFYLEEKGGWIPGGRILGRTPWNKGKKGVMPIPWNKGKKDHLSAETIQKMSLAKIGKPPPNKGMARPYMLGELNPNWKGGNTNPRTLDMTTQQYIQWKIAVFEKDHYKCVVCGETRRRQLQADHIKMYASHPELRYEVYNGQTLCKKCHREKTKDDLSIHFKVLHNLNELIKEGLIIKREIITNGIKIYEYKAVS